MSRSRFAGAALVLALLCQGLLVGAASAQDVTVDMIDFEFVPREVTVAPGSTVTWVNHDPFPHTVTADDGSFSENANPGQSITLTFDEPQTFSYFCKFHGFPGEGMAGTVTVGDEPPPEPPRVDRLDADDNVGAAIAWSAYHHEHGGADFALIGRDDLFADSLSSGAVQGALDAPLLLTGGAALDPRTAAELARLQVRTVYLLGGSAALSPEVAEGLRAEGYAVRRVSGPNRVATAVEVAERFFPAARNVLLARAFGDDADPTRAFADSLGAGAYAAATAQPVLLTAGGALSPETRDYLAGRPVEAVTVVGGEHAVGAAVVAELEAMGLEVERVAGANRFGTAAELSLRADPQAAPQLAVAVEGEGERAWASGFPAAVLGAPVVLLAGERLPSETAPLLVGAAGFGLSLVCGPFVPTAGCDHVEIAASSDVFGGPSWRVAMLEGGREVPGPGAEQVTGLAEVFGTADPASLCYSYEEFGLDPPVSQAHIHLGAAGVAGPIVVPLDTTVGPFGTVTNCVFDLDDGLVADILNNPRAYYVNLHTEAFPEGAIRGQLFAVTGLMIADMSGEQVIPGPGDPAGVGFMAGVRTDEPTELCLLLGAFLDEPVTAANVHLGRETETGEALLELPYPTPAGPPLLTACLGGLDPDLVEELSVGDGRHYAQLSTGSFPDGAVRGQLFDLFGPPPEDDAPPPDDDHEHGQGGRSRVAERASGQPGLGWLRRLLE